MRPEKHAIHNLLQPYTDVQINSNLYIIMHCIQYIQPASYIGMYTAS